MGLTKSQIRYRIEKKVGKITVGAWGDGGTTGLMYGFRRRKA